MKKVFILLVILMLSVDANLFAQEKYGEEFKFSKDKSTVSSVFVTTSFETLKTWSITKSAQYYLGLNEKSDTVIRNLILSPTGRYNYPGDSLVYSWSKLFAKTRVFHREFVVSQEMRDIDVKIKEGDSIPINWENTFVVITKFLLITMGILFLGFSKNNRKEVVIATGVLFCILIVALTIVCIPFSHFLKVPLFDYFFVMLLILLPPLIVSVRKSGAFREIKAGLIMNKAMRDMDKHDIKK